MLINKPSGEFKILSPFGQTPFYAYRNALKKGAAKKKYEFCQSSMHFIYSEKFRGHEECRQAILSMKSGREIEKANLTFTSEGKTRNDWLEVRDSIVECGIRHAMLAHHDIYDTLMEGEDDIIYQSNTNHELGINADGHGENLYGKAMERIRKKIQTNSFVNVGVFGQVSINNKNALDKICNLFSRTKPDYVSFNTEDNGLSEFADHWAQTQYATIVNIPKNIRPGMLTHAVMFGDRTDQTVITRAMEIKAMGVLLKIIDGKNQ
jgi:predicted NAD-dependent protein-ADP-ribosyltransferase YbiA (DUF1768 family)